MPQRDIRLLLQDTIDACDVIAGCAAHMTLAQYSADIVIRSAVERQFEIIGEAIKRVIEAEPGLTLRLPEAREVIDFRDFLAHGYHLIDHSEVWKIIQTDLSSLRYRVVEILSERP